MQLTGVKKVEYQDFSRRKWRSGEEMLHAFMLDLENMAALLSIPQGMVKVQFVEGLPCHIASQVRPFDSAEENCEKVLKLAEGFLKEETKVAPVKCSDDGSTKNDKETLELMQK